MPAMDQRELDSYVKQLNKCIVANEAPENALRLLDTLKKDAAPTEEMLRVRPLLARCANFCDGTRFDSHFLFLRQPAPV